MKNVLALLSLVAVAVSSTPLVFDSHLLEHGDVNGRLSVLHHSSFVHGEAPGKVVGAAAARLRFLLLVPKLSTRCQVKDGVASKALGGALKTHSFVKLEDSEHLVDLAGLSDCKTWHGVLLKVWNPTGVTHKAVAGLKGADGVFKLHHFLDVPALVDFVKDHLMVHLVKGLLAKGVAAHVLTHHLHHSFHHLL